MGQVEAPAAQPLLKAVAPVNIYAILVTALVFHDPMFWLKAVALVNIYDIFVTARVSQRTVPPMVFLLISWLKLVAWNIANILLTFLVSHDPMFWLKLVALRNIDAIFVTLLVSQFQLAPSPLKVVLPPAPRKSNMKPRSIVDGVVKIGASLAVTSMLLHP